MNPNPSLDCSYSYTTETETELKFLGKFEPRSDKIVLIIKRALMFLCCSVTDVV